MIRALVCQKLGNPGEQGNHAPLRVSEQAPPGPVPPNGVRIKIAAASLNFADALQVQGQYQEKKNPPFVPGEKLLKIKLHPFHKLPSAVGLQDRSAIS